VARDRLHPESVARLDEALRAGSTIVAPIAALDARGSWWEIAAGTGDTRAVGVFGLHSGKGPILGVKNNPGQILKSRGAQQNLFDGVKAFETPAAREERLRAARQLFYKSRTEAFERRAQLRIGQMQSPRTASSATGYTLLAVIGGLIKEFVITAIAVWAIEQLVSSVKEFVDTYGDR
jgi:hypothetical protein